MSNYIAENLGKDEKVIMEAKLNKLCFVPRLITIGLGLIFLIVALVLPDYLFVVTVSIVVFSASAIITGALNVLALWNMSLVVTDKRILGKVGILSIATLDYPIEKVDNISLKAGVLGNFFKYYALSIQTAGTSDATSKGIKFDGIENAVEFKNVVVAAIEQHAEDARRLQAEEIAKAMASKQ